jgi:SAM-dependent methyltransferase
LEKRRASEEKVAWRIQTLSTAFVPFFSRRLQRRDTDTMDEAAWAAPQSTVSAPTRALWWVLQGTWSLCANYVVRPIVWLSSLSYELFWTCVVGTASWLARSVVSYGLYPSLGVFACGALWTALERKRRYYLIGQHVLPSGWVGRIMIPTMYQAEPAAGLTEWATRLVMESVPAADRTEVLDVGCGTGVSLAMFVGGRARVAQREALMTETESDERRARKLGERQEQRRQRRRQGDDGSSCDNASSASVTSETPIERRVGVPPDEDEASVMSNDTSSCSSGDETSYEDFPSVVEATASVRKASNDPLCGSTSSSSSSSSAQAHGVDASAAMLETCMRSCSRQIAKGRVVLHHALADSLPFADASFDVVFSCNTLHLFPDLEGVFR